MVDFEYKESYVFDDLVGLVKVLRKECPWDREQNHKSIRRNLLEEAYEAAEAIDLEDPDLLKEELGDVLLQVVFHAEMEEEVGSFTIDAVSDGVCKKLIERHPHIFGEVQASSTTEVLENWEVIKRQQKGQATLSSAMDAVAKSLPALWRAEKIQSKAEKAGFGFPDTDTIWEQLASEADELKAAKDLQSVEDELGDYLFTVVGLAQKLNVDPESALERACDKFTKRFKHVEKRAAELVKPIDEMEAALLDKIWQEAKSENP